MFFVARIEIKRYYSAKAIFLGFDMPGKHRLLNRRNVLFQLI